ncbi:MAG: hypothetical protein R3Y50_07180 [Rikenellaceae bacterium]
MKRLSQFFIAALAFLASCTTTPERTSVSIVGEDFYLNGEATFKGKEWRGHSIEGLLPNSRMVNGIFDDRTDSTRYRWVYPDTKVWDAERNVSEFIENMPLWRESGLLAFTINLQGGSPYGYSSAQPWHNSAINGDGSLDEAFMGRLERVLDKADELGMVAIVGLYYFGQEKFIDDEVAVKKGVENSIKWIISKGYENVIIEINNECNYYKVHPILAPERVHELIALGKGVNVDGKRLLVGTSYGGGHLPSEEVVEVSDFILLHGNGQHKPERIVKMVEKVRAMKSYTPKPIVFNEDDHFDFEKDWNNFVAATSVGASWGYFDYRKGDDPFEQGFQCVPSDWSIGSPRKKGFFGLLRQW